ncbi:MAG: Squalene epoxidase [Cirrosporium novae-zelandiae]|nr:MAG: Squalene epoxidase [Cirrosporium novae-zelandiae]
MPLILDSAERPDFRIERREEHHEADIVIVGAGVVGCALATNFARQNRSVILIERSLKEPDRIVGELLQPGGIRSLEQLGMQDCLEGIDAIPSKGYDVIYYGQEADIPYTDQSLPKDAPKPEAKGFHHGRFIMKLREAAMKEKNVLVVETTATDLVKDDHTNQILGVQCTTKGENDYYFGHLTIIADGYASKFRKQHLQHQPTVKSKFFALELLDADLPNPYHGHVIISEQPPSLFYQIGTHETRALIDIPDVLPCCPNGIGNGGIKVHLRDHVTPTLPKNLQPSFLEALEKGTSLRSMPNSFLPPSVNKTKGMILIGDAMNMRHPLTGGGMTVAFNDCVLVRDLLAPEKVSDLGNTDLVLKQMAIFHEQRKHLGSVINILSMALYSLFAADDYHLKVLQKGCFNYFLLGGNCVDEPVGLLSGVIARRLVLLYHFYAVALLSIWVMIKEAPIYMFPFKFLESFAVFWKACVVIGPFIWSEL